MDCAIEFTDDNSKARVTGPNGQICFILAPCVHAACARSRVRFLAMDSNDNQVDIVCWPADACMALWQSSCQRFTPPQAPRETRMIVLEIQYHLQIWKRKGCLAPRSGPALAQALHSSLEGARQHWYWTCKWQQVNRSSMQLRWAIMWALYMYCILPVLGNCSCSGPMMYHVDLLTCLCISCTLGGAGCRTHAYMRCTASS